MGDTLPNQQAQVTTGRRRARGHRLLALCPPSPRFPAAVARELIERFTRRGDRTLDPYCRHCGAVAQAAWQGREGLAVAPDEAARVATQVVLEPPEPREVFKRLRELENDMFYGDPSGEREEIQRAFSPETLRRLVHVRSSLEREDTIDTFIAATTAGWLRERERRGRDRGGRIDLDVFEALDQWTRRLLHGPPPAGRWRLWRGRGGRLGPEAKAALRRHPPRLVLAAPPHSASRGDGALSRWFLGMEEPAGEGRRADTPRDVPGLLAWLVEEYGEICGLLEPGAICALSLRDVVLQGRPPRVIRMAQRVWERFREAGVEVERVALDVLGSPSVRLAPPTRADASGQKERPMERLLVMRARPGGGSG